MTNLEKVAFRIRVVSLAVSGLFFITQAITDDWSSSTTRRIACLMIFTVITHIIVIQPKRIYKTKVRSENPSIDDPEMINTQKSANKNILSYTQGDGVRIGKNNTIVTYR